MRLYGNGFVMYDGAIFRSVEKLYRRTRRQSWNQSNLVMSHDDFTASNGWLFMTKSFPGACDLPEGKLWLRLVIDELTDTVLADTSAKATLTLCNGRVVKMGKQPVVSRVVEGVGYRKTLTEKNTSVSRKWVGNWERS